VVQFTHADQGDLRDTQPKDTTMNTSKFEIGTVYTNLEQRNTPACIVAGWKCIGRKVTVRKNARWKSTSEIITARFVRVDKDGIEFGNAISLRVSNSWMEFEQVQWGRFCASLRLESVSVIAKAAA
jgi:hypothetical protein